MCGYTIQHTQYTYTYIYVYTHIQLYRYTMHIRTCIAWCGIRGNPIEFSLGALRLLSFHSPCAVGVYAALLQEILCATVSFDGASEK